jgi:hypothetical protein
MSHRANLCRILLSHNYMGCHIRVRTLVSDRPVTAVRTYVVQPTLNTTRLIHFFPTHRATTRHRSSNNRITSRTIAMNSMFTEYIHTYIHT